MLMKWKYISELLKFHSSLQNTEWEKFSEFNDKNRIKTFGTLLHLQQKSFTKSGVKISILIG